MSTTTGDTMTLDLEYRLTIAYRLGCECSRYFIERREVLIPAVLAEAERRGQDADDVFAEYARKVHLRHLAGNTLEVAA